MCLFYEKASRCSKQVEQSPAPPSGPAAGSWSPPTLQGHWGLVWSFQHATASVAVLLPTAAVLRQSVCFKNVSWHLPCPEVPPVTPDHWYRRTCGWWQFASHPVDAGV